MTVSEPIIQSLVRNNVLLLLFRVSIFFHLLVNLFNYENNILTDFFNPKPAILKVFWRKRKDKKIYKIEIEK